MNDSFMHKSDAVHCLSSGLLKQDETDKCYPTLCPHPLHSCYILSTWWTELCVAIGTHAAEAHNIPR